MSTQVKIQLHDLISAAKNGKLADIVERDPELSRLARIMLRPNNHHVAVVGEPGVGKTSLVEALAIKLHRGHFRPLKPVMYRLSPEPIMALLVNGDSVRTCLNALSAATKQLEAAIIVVEDIHLLATDDPGRLELTMALLQAIASHQGIKLIVTTTQSAFRQVFASDYIFNRMFDDLSVVTPTEIEARIMVGNAVPRLEAQNRQLIEDAAVDEAVKFGGRFGHGRALPDAAIRLLEETCVKVTLDGESLVTASDIQDIVAERERIPTRDLETTQRDRLVDLEVVLKQSVVGQPRPLQTIARTIPKSQLGLSDPSKPRGSFLLLGPSGVGKTETAKSLAKLVFDNPQALVRLDMSEYGEAHSGVRLIGSPPGYVGYEEGGQLTGAVAKEPYSIILLDEIEKAHVKLFDLFLQLLDDGRLTDSSGQTVDFTETLVLATSNAASFEISEAAMAGLDVHSPDFMNKTVLPILMQSFRPEFINRFDAILVYQPLGMPQLVSLAQRELATLSKRLSTVGVSFDVSDELLASLLLPIANPLFGARPVKRLIATQFETPLATKLISRELVGPITITGTEQWLSPELVA
jgi:ATP-dependent Clp protease ATP-binding subunit ClpC